MKRKQGFIMGVSLLLMLALGTLSGCGSQAPEEEPAVRAIPVEVAEVAKGTVTITDTVTGSLNPVVEVPVVPKLGGKIARVAVSVGDRVQAGDLLVQLDTSDIEAQVRQAEAAVEAAKTGYANAEAKLPNALTIAQANYDAAKSAYDRMEYLYEEGGVSEQQLEGARTQLEVAAAQLADAQNASLQLDTLRAQVKQAEAAYDAARTQLNNATITAPVSGTVTAVHMDVGQMSGPSTPLVTVAQLDPMVAVFSLTESQVGKLKTGDQVSVQVKVAGSEPWQGRVSEVAPSADPRTRTYLVKVELPNGDGMLKGGMTAQVGLALDSVEDAVVVPVNSIVTKGNRQNIYLLEGETVRECPVEILLQNDEVAAISGEVKVGAKVVIAGQNLLQDGTLVRDVTGEGK